MALIDQAREWIGDMLHGARNAIRGQRAQSVFRIPSSFLPTSLQNGHRSAPEAVTYGVDSPNLNRLKQYCLRAFGGQEYNGTTDAEEVYEPNNSKSIARDEMRNGTHSIRCGISLANLEEVVNSCVNKSASRKSEAVEIDTAPLTSTGNGNTSNRPNSMLQYSTDSGVNIDFAEFSGGQRTCTSELSTLSYRENNEISRRIHHQITAEKDKDHAGREIIQESKEAETESEETFSKLYSVFCKKPSNIRMQKKAKSSKNKCIEKARSLSGCLRTNMTKKHTGSIRLSEKYKPKISGKITLGLQHFKKSRQLRVILLSAETSVEHDRKMFCKVKLIGNSSSQKQITHQLSSNSGNVDIRETFYMDLKVDDLTEYVLQVQLSTVSRFPQRKSIAGVAYIALGNFDLMLDTTMSVKLRDSISSRQVSAEDDLEIISENRSIHADLTALLQESDHPDTRYSRTRRHQSLPQINHDRVSVYRPRRAKTLDSKVCTTSNRQDCEFAFSVTQDRVMNLDSKDQTTTNRQE